MDFDTLRPVLVAIVSAAVVYGLMGFLRRAKPARMTPSGGIVRLGSGITWFLVIGGLVFSALGIWGVLGKAEITERLSGAAITILGIACLMTATLTLAGRHDVVWSNDGIQGPSKRFAALLWFSRTAIPWPDVRKLEVSGSNYHFVEAVDGRRIYWSLMTAGTAALMDAICDSSPNLIDEDDNEPVDDDFDDPHEPQVQPDGRADRTP